jgi:thymidylate synthase (FAD)
MELRSDIRVVEDPEQSCGSDRDVAKRAWVERPDRELPSTRDDSPRGWGRLIDVIMRERHGTVFEGGLLTVYVEAPVVFWWEATRHRIASFNLESGRYKLMEGVFYMVPEDRPCREPDGFKPMRPELVEDEAANRWARVEQRRMAEAAWASYRRQLGYGVAREVARLVLTFGFYYSGYMTLNARSWMNFFSLRRYDPAARVVSRPQKEIEKVCVAVESIFAARWPLVYDSFTRNGRVAP